MATGPIIEATLGLDTTQFQRGLMSAEKAALGFQGALSRFAGVANFFSTGLAALGIGRVFDAAFASANEASRAAIEAGREVDALTAATLRSEAAFKAAGKAAGDLAKFVVGNLALVGEQFGVIASGEPPQSSGFVDRLREVARTQDLATVQQMATQRARELDERIAEFDRREAEIDLGPVAFARPAQATRAARRAFLVDEARRELAAIALALRSAEQEAEQAAERFAEGGADLFRELAQAAERSSEQFRSEMERISREADEDADARIERLASERERLIALGESGQAEDPVRIAEEVQRITEEIREIEGDRWRNQQIALDEQRRNARLAELEAERRTADARRLRDIERDIAGIRSQRAEAQARAQAFARGGIDPSTRAPLRGAQQIAAEGSGGFRSSEPQRGAQAFLDESERNLLRFQRELRSVGSEPGPNATQYERDQYNRNVARVRELNEQAERNFLARQNEIQDRANRRVPEMGEAARRAAASARQEASVFDDQLERLKEIRDAITGANTAT